MEASDSGSDWSEGESSWSSAVALEQSLRVMQQLRLLGLRQSERMPPSVTSSVIADSTSDSDSGVSETTSASDTGEDGAVQPDPGMIPSTSQTQVKGIFSSEEFRKELEAVTKRDADLASDTFPMGKYYHLHWILDDEIHAQSISDSESNIYVDEYNPDSARREMLSIRERLSMQRRLNGEESIGSLAENDRSGPSEKRPKELAIDHYSYHAYYQQLNEVPTNHWKSILFHQMPGLSDYFTFVEQAGNENMGIEFHQLYPEKVMARKPQFSSGECVIDTCDICYGTRILNRRLCCQILSCAECTTRYVIDQLASSSLCIECPDANCKVPIKSDEISARLNNIEPSMSKWADIYRKRLLEAQLQPNQQMCPQCSHVIEISDNLAAKISKMKKVEQKVLRVTCERCDVEFCWKCHVPWHQNLSCKKFQGGQILLKSWAQNKENKGTRNAQRCPKCKAYFQKTSGCDHMQCKTCKTDFCYRCGGRYTQIKFIGKHGDKYSVLGCKQNLLPNRPVLRRTVRGGILAGAVPVALLLGTGAVLVGVTIILPSYGLYRGGKAVKRRVRRRFQITRRSVDL